MGYLLLKNFESEKTQENFRWKWRVQRPYRFEVCNLFCWRILRIALDWISELHLWKMFMISKNGLGGQCGSSCVDFHLSIVLGTFNPRAAGIPYIRIYIYTYTYIHIYTHIRKYTYTPIHIYIHIYTYIYINIHINACISKCIYVYV